MDINTILYAAFPGTGKSYLCTNFADTCKEIECWKYREKDFPENYIQEVIKFLGKTKYLFISTDPVILKGLNKLNIKIHLVYPQNKLKKEYHKRYRERKSHTDFIEAYDKYWDIWLNELKEQKYCNHIILKKGQYLQAILKTDLT